jgi:23S rRNA pseudouridine2605 synthase
MTTRRPPRTPSEPAGRRGGRSDQGGRSNRQGGRNATRGDAPSSAGPRGEQPRGDRSFGDRPRGERPQGDRPRSDRPQGERPRGDRPQGERLRADRPHGDRPYGERQRSERPQGERRFGDRNRADRPQGDRPRSERPQGERSFGDRNRADRPQGDRPRGERPQGERPRGQLQFGERRQGPAARSGEQGQRTEARSGYAQRGERGGAARPDRSRDDRAPVAGQRRERRERPNEDFFADEQRPRGERRFGDRQRDARSAGPRTSAPRAAAPRDEGLSFGRPRAETPRSDAPRSDVPRADSPRPERKPFVRKLPPRGVVAPLEPEDVNDYAYHDEPQRIAKLLARAGVGSRRDAERMIEEGRVTLNGELLQQPAPLLKSLDGLAVDGVPVARPVSTRLFRFYKPNGCLTAARDPQDRKTIYDVLPDGLPRLMPVGRLDYNTEGLLLMTNDGEFKRELELPSTGVERTYRARAFGEVSQAQLEELAMGVEIDGIRYGKIDANLERRTGANQWIEMTLTEGKNREVRNVLEYLGLQVNRLIRVRYGDFTIEGLEPGDVDVVPRDIVNQFRRKLR